MHFIVSYPKSGRTWVRFMVNSYLIRQLGLPTDDVVAVEASLEKTPQHFMWSHYYGAMLSLKNYFEMEFQYKQAVGFPHILITRNLYGTLASAYYHGRYRKAIFDKTPADFVRCPMFGIIKLVTFYNQLEALKPHYPKFDAFIYEDLRKDVPGVFSQIVEALGLTVDAKLIDEVVEAGLLANMQKTAADPRYANTWLGEIDPNAPMNRECKVGNNKRYHELFSQEDMDYIAQVIDCLLLNKNAPHLRDCLTPPPVKTKAAAA